MLNLILIPDTWLKEATERIQPHNWVFSLDRPHEISGNLKLQGPVVDTGVNFVLETAHL